MQKMWRHLWTAPYKRISPLVRYETRNETMILWDKIQVQLECCGVEGVSDWETILNSTSSSCLAPHSCLVICNVQDAESYIIFVKCLGQQHRLLWLISWRPAVPEWLHTAALHCWLSRGPRRDSRQIQEHHCGDCYIGLDDSHDKLCLLLCPLRCFRLHRIYL